MVWLGCGWAVAGLWLGCGLGGVCWGVLERDGVAVAGLTWLTRAVLGVNRNLRAQVLKQGKADTTRPQTGTVVDIAVQSVTIDGKPVDKKDNECFRIGDGDVCHGTARPQHCAPPCMLRRAGSIK